MRFAIASGAALGFLGVALGAFGAHALRDRLDAPSMAIYQTGVHYQLVHAVVLVALGLFGKEAKLLRWASASYAAGVVLFSFSLYALALSGARAFGAITPFGGVLFLAGWLLLLLWALKPSEAVP